MRWIYIGFTLITVVCTSAGQLILKDRLAVIGGVPADLREMPGFFASVLCDPQVILAFAVMFAGAMTYIAALSKLPLTYIYPFASLTFPLVLAAGWLLFGEALTWQKAVGSAVIVMGVAISASSA